MNIDDAIKIYQDKYDAYMKMNKQLLNINDI